MTEQIMTGEQALEHVFKLNNFWNENNHIKIAFEEGGWLNFEIVIDQKTVFKIHDKITLFTRDHKMKDNSTRVTLMTRDSQLNFFSDPGYHGPQRSEFNHANASIYVDLMQYLDDEAFDSLFEIIQDIQTEAIREYEVQNTFYQYIREEHVALP